MRKPRKWSDDEMIELLQHEARRKGSTPTPKDVNTRPDMPSRNTYASRFGSWTKALLAAGLERRENSVLCAGSTRDGDPCGNHKARGSQYCATHQRRERRAFRTRAEIVRDLRRRLDPGPLPIERRAS